MNNNWNGYTVLLSSVEKGSTAETFGVNIPRSFVKAKVIAKTAYHQYLANKVRCTPGMIAGVVKKGLDFAIIAPTRRVFRRNLEFRWKYHHRIGGIHGIIRLDKGTFDYQVFVIA